MSDESHSVSQFTGLGNRVIEVMNDIGRLHDLLEKLPADVKNALTDTLNLIAEAVEHTEQTTKSVLDDFNSQLKSAREAELNKAGCDIKEIIETSVKEALTDKLSKASETVDYINNTLNTPREISSKVLILLGAMGAITITSIFGMLAVLFLK